MAWVLAHQQALAELLLLVSELLGVGCALLGLKSPAIVVMLAQGAKKVYALVMKQDPPELPPVS